MATAAPAVSSITTAEGTLTQPSRYESGARHQWRRLCEAVRDGEHLDDLPGLADDLDLLRQL